MAAVVVLIRPDEFYRSEAGFNDLAEALAAEWFDPGIHHPLTAAECAWALMEARLIDPPDPGEGPSPAVVRFVNLAVKNDGFDHLPGVFRAFGVPPDPGVAWGPDVTGTDPDLAAAAVAGSDDAEHALTSDLADKLLALADKLLALPLSSPGRVRAVAAELRAKAVPPG